MINDVNCDNSGKQTFAKCDENLYQIQLEGIEFNNGNLDL